MVQETPLQKKAIRQLEEYLAGQRQTFDFAFTAAGTEFQKSVWEALRNIPYGETRSYKQIAQMIGRPNAARAVGMANHRNPIMIVTPCHRVIAADGSLAGYAGGLEVKKKLLELEKQHLYAGAVAPSQNVQLG
ncbi:methylated-DNA--[protein]-cysteine S-methyltransferase [Syntrophomonas zehnderi]|uniref:methylated-DNA--[protein]-cysteine S-methyltransferase n=1 Tax=Syntrophomonas zehnderi TaxID=404335 RepID=UPI0006988B65|nr:methylated-DNA--[protein]-cysteine S-methyltransferase [Syntrophomonas zehnderi]